MTGTTSHYDFGARQYDNRLGRWFATDPLEVKYPYCSTYSFALNTPIKAVDREGKDVILIIWATGNGMPGHAAIAVSNYKTVELIGPNGELGGTITIPDGTYTYYDNWPGNGVDLSGKDGAMTTVTAYRSKDYGEKGVIIGDISEFTFENLTKTHPLAYAEDKNGNTIYQNGKKIYVGIPNEDHMQDGVLVLHTSYGQDTEIRNELEGLNKDELDYNGKDFNCSTYVSCGLKSLLGDGLGLEMIKGIVETVTPNRLYIDVKEKAQEKGIKMTEQLDPKDKVNIKFDEAMDGGSGSPITTPPTESKSMDFDRVGP